MTRSKKPVSARGRVDRGSSLDARDLAIDEAVSAALRGETAAIAGLPRDLQAEAQQRFNERSDAQRRAELREQRANPLHVDPAEGLH